MIRLARSLGSSSLHAVDVCIDVITGLVIDYELMLPTLSK